MATTPLKPKTLQEVLAEQNKVVTPPTPENRDAIIAQNKAQLEANKAKAAERSQDNIQKAGVKISASIPTPADTPQVDLGGGPAYVTSQFPGQVFATKSAMDSAVKSGVIAPGSTYKPNIPTAKTSSPAISTIKTPEVPKIDTPNVPKVQTGKLVSDFNKTLSAAGDDVDKYYEGINYAGLSEEDKKRADTLFDMKQKAKKEMAAKPKDEFDTLATTVKDTLGKQATQLETDRAKMEAAQLKQKDLVTKDIDEAVGEYESALSTFDTEQKSLLSNYESNRLNQVQGDLRRALLSRGIDVTKIPQEQLIALSGSIGAQAFSDISAAKERALSAIENARQNKVAKVRQLKANKALTEAQYETAVANINSTAEQAKLNTKLKEAETIFNIKSQQVAKKEKTTADTSQTILNTLQTMGVSGSQFKVAEKIMKDAKTTPEALRIIVSELANPDSELYTILQSNEDAAIKAQVFKNQIELLKAQKSGRSGGGTTPNPDYTGGNQ